MMIFRKIFWENRKHFPNICGQKIYVGIQLEIDRSAGFRTLKKHKKYCFFLIAQSFPSPVPVLEQVGARVCEGKLIFGTHYVAYCVSFQCVSFGFTVNREICNKLWVISCKWSISLNKIGRRILPGERTMSYFMSLTIRHNVKKRHPSRQK